MSVLCYFVAQLAKDGLKHRTMKVYLSAVRHLHIEEGKKDPFQAPLNRLHNTLWGAKREEAQKAGDGRVRLPITPVILRKMKAAWRSRASDPDTIMLWAAACLGFFGFLRAGEMTMPSDGAYDPAVHLSYSDIAVDNPSSPSVLRVSIKQSKTDAFRKGIDLFLGRSSTDLAMSGSSHAKLLGRKRFRRRPTIQVRRWTAPDETAACQSSEGGSPQLRPRSVAVLRPQLSDWGCDDCSNEGDGRFGHKDAGTVEESGLPGVHQDSERRASQLL